MKRIFSGLIILTFLGSGLAYAGEGPYTNSAHGNSTSGVDRAKTGYVIDAKYADYSPGNCAHCHEAHASLDGSEPAPTGGPDEVLLFDYEEDLCETCHDGNPVTADVKTQSAKDYSHPIHVTNGKHTLREYGQSGAPFRESNRHAECADCHEPHFIGYPGTTYHTYNTTTPADNNLVSNLLKGVWGVEPKTSPLWSPPTGFTEQKTIAVGSAKEYQICFKCHSYYALQDADGITAITGPSGGLITDQAMEFSPGNKSAHPIQVGLNSQTGSSAPKPLAAAQMKAPWKTSSNMGVQTMYCSDCHGNDASGGGISVGPHGSDNKFLLVGYAGETQKTLHWFEKSTTALWQLDDVTSTTIADNIFCVNCHVLYPWQNKAHSESDDKHDDDDGVCVKCHVAVPHGSARSRLIAYSSDPSPYDYQNDYAKITSYSKQTRNDYSKEDCKASCSSRNH